MAVFLKDNATPEDISVADDKVYTELKQIVSVIIDINYL